MRYKGWEEPYIGWKKHCRECGNEYMPCCKEQMYCGPICKEAAIKKTREGLLHCLLEEQNVGKLMAIADEALMELNRKCIREEVLRIDKEIMGEYSGNKKL